MLRCRGPALGKLGRQKLRVRHGLPDEYQPPRSGKQLASQVHCSNHRRPRADRSEGKRNLRSRRQLFTRPHHADDCRVGGKLIPAGDCEVAGHPAGRHDRIKRSVAVLFEQPAGRPLGVALDAAEPHEVEIFNKHLVAAAWVSGQRLPKALHEADEGGPRRHLLINHEHPAGSRWLFGGRRVCGVQPPSPAEQQRGQQAKRRNQLAQGIAVHCL